MITKQIYGQAFIAEDSLYQDIVLLTIDDNNNRNQSENTVKIIDDIWKDLMSNSSKAKTDKKGYWYWEVDMSTLDETDSLVKVKVSCPKPGPELFDYDFEEKSGDSDWTKYWKGKMSQVKDSVYNSTNGLQQKEIILPGTKYINQNGETVEVEETKITRNDLGDIQNLLNCLF